jgi:hypothetical protein
MPKSRKIISRSKIIYIFLSIFSWLSFSYIIIFINPLQWQNIYFAPFFLNLFLLLIFTYKIFLKPSIPALIISIAIISFLILRLFGFKDWYSPVLIIGLTVSLIYFFTVKDEGANLADNNSINQTVSDSKSKTNINNSNQKLKSEK